MLFSIEKLLLKEYIAPPFYAAELLSNKLFFKVWNCTWSKIEVISSFKFLTERIKPKIFKWFLRVMNYSMFSFELLKPIF